MVCGEKTYSLSSRGNMRVLFLVLLFVSTVLAETIDEQRIRWFRRAIHHVTIAAAIGPYDLEACPLDAHRHPVTGVHRIPLGGDLSLCCPATILEAWYSDPLWTPCQGTDPDVETCQAILLDDGADHMRCYLDSKTSPFRK